MAFAGNMNKLVIDTTGQ